MTKRDVVKLALAGERPPYVPWNFSFTVEAYDRLAAHYGTRDPSASSGQALDVVLGNHLLGFVEPPGYFTDIGHNCVRDPFGVVWDRSVDKDIGNVTGLVLPEPTLAGYTFPDPVDRDFFATFPAQIAQAPDRFRYFGIGFSLWERAWTMRGMTNLMMDFHDHPDFVHQLLRAISEWNVARVEAALKYDVDAIYYGDDWGQQRGLQMGPALWRRFILPALTPMYRVARDAGKYVFIHSCGDVDELFDDLIAIGLSCFNPFQPEVMAVDALLRRYHGRLAFFGGLSTQRVLPYGSVDDVQRETRRLIDLGRNGGYILAPAHAVEGDVPLANMLAFIEACQAQPGYRAGGD